MEQLWAGGFHGALSSVTDDFNSSVRFDSRMAQEDIAGSLAHAAMLEKQGIINVADGEAIRRGLTEIAAELADGVLQIDQTAEDIHTFIEAELTARIGDAGKRLHTGRSRNDQVALDLRLYLLAQLPSLHRQLDGLIAVLCNKAEQYADAIMPGYTHLQRAQPITFGHHLLAYAEMLLRDRGRLTDCEKRMNICPLGSGALAGTTYPLNRDAVADALSMNGVTHNSLDGVSDRDYAVELAGALSLIMVHLSRFSEEVILWCSWEFRFITLDDGFSTGSSIMPQKKNPDIAELVRGKSGRVFGDLLTLLTVLKGLPLAYNKDLQEDKEAIFDALDTVSACLTAFTPMLDTMTVNTDRMRAAAAGGFINATDVADYLTCKGVPFRDAYKATGDLIARCVALDLDLESLPIEEYKAIHPLFEADVFDAISLENCVNRRCVCGGPAPDHVRAEAARVRRLIS